MKKLIFTFLLFCSFCFFAYASTNAVTDDLFKYVWYGVIPVVIGFMMKYANSQADKKVSLGGSDSYEIKPVGLYPILGWFSISLALLM